MRITSRFTIAVHILTCIDYFKEERKITSDFLAASVGVHPVLIRTVLGKLRAAGIVSTHRGSSDTVIARPLSEITFYDIYRALDCVEEDGLFHFHENPNPDCPVGRGIHTALDGRLRAIQASMEQEMRQITLAEIVADTKQGAGNLPTGGTQGENPPSTAAPGGPGPAQP